MGSRSAGSDRAGEGERAISRESLDAIRHNRPLVLLCLSALFMLTGMFTLQTLQVYYARDVLGCADFQIVLTVLSIGGMLVVSPVIPRIVETFGKKRTYVAAGIVTTAGAVGIALTPPSVLAPALVFFAVYDVGIAAVQNLIFALQADTVEYGEWETGVRTEGSTTRSSRSATKLVKASVMLSPPSALEERFREVVRQIALRRADRAGARERLPGSEA